MKTELLVATIAGVVALASAGGTILGQFRATEMGSNLLLRVLPHGANPPE